MFCKNCGSAVRETSKFCGGCGARVEADSATRPQQPTPSRSAMPAAPRQAAAPARSQTGARPPARPTAPAQPRTPASPPKLRFHTLLEDYLAAEGWDDELEVDAEARSVTLNTGIGTGNLEFSLIIEASDQTECVDAYVYYRRVKCKESRLSEMCQLFNLIHIESGAGLFSVLPEGHIRWSHRVDFEGSTPTAVSLQRLVHPGLSAAARFVEPITAVALTRQTAPDAWAEFNESS